MKKLLTICFVFLMGIANAQWTGIDVPPVKITVNPNWSITFTQEFLPGTPTINNVVFSYVAGQGNWTQLVNVSGASIVGNQLVWTSPACLLTDSIQYAGGAGVYFADPQYVQGTGFSTTFLRIPCLTFQGTGGCCGAPTGTACASSGTCAPAPTPNGNGNGNGPGQFKPKKK